jgi:hypothetical protein
VDVCEVSVYFYSISGRDMIPFWGSLGRFERRGVMMIYDRQHGKRILSAHTMR